MRCIHRADACIPQHDERQFIVDIIDEDGNAVDITNATVTWIVASRVTSAILLTKTTSDSSVVKASASRVQWDITSAESGALPTRHLYHEMRVVNSAGEPSTVMAGVFTVQDTRIGD